MHGLPWVCTRVADGSRLEQGVGDAFEQQFFEPARQRYGERRWSKAHAAGARLRLEEAIELALSSSPRGVATTQWGPRTE
jgi:hypothetical protein